MTSALSRLDWKLELMHLPADVAYELFLHILKGLKDMYVPLDSGRRRIPWSSNPPAALKSAKAAAWNH